jgi:hypothetical protein
MRSLKSSVASVRRCECRFSRDRCRTASTVCRAERFNADATTADMRHSDPNTLHPYLE